MSSKSKKTGRKKSKSKAGKIELEEIAAEEVSKIGSPIAAGATLGKTLSGKDSARAPKAKYVARVLPALTDGRTNGKYEKTLAALLNSDELNEYKLVTVLPSGDAQHFIAFFRLKK